MTLMVCACVVAVQALAGQQLLLDPMPHECAQQQGSLLVAYSVAANEVGVMFAFGFD
jgi:hypothetical protein